MVEDDHLIFKEAKESLNSQQNADKEEEEFSYNNESNGEEVEEEDHSRFDEAKESFISQQGAGKEEDTSYNYESNEKRGRGG